MTHDDHPYRWTDLAIIVVLALLAIVTVLQVLPLVRDPRFSETPEGVDAVQVDSVGTTPDGSFPAERAS